MRHLLTAVLMVLCVPSANAFIFFFPIPNLAKPAALNSIIDALEKSDETKAVAYVSEDKTFGSKQWAWGQYSGHVPQHEADRIALANCRATLERARTQSVGGKPLYDFGTKSCELHSFTNSAVSVRANEWRPPNAIPTPALVPTVATAPAQPVSEPVSDVPVVAASAPDVTASQSLPTPIPPSAVAEQQTVALQPAPVASSAASENQTARKLRELNALKNEGLITESEYQAKRKALISAM